MDLHQLPAREERSFGFRPTPVAEHRSISRHMTISWGMSDDTIAQLIGELRAFRRP